ncbi:MAG: PEP-CTERM sorting domain-containing protein [Verrucomicrobiota bacterium]|nr:PEP-CTERM sorting domain-containing protein [Verrucomicrobiota bacterium]
MKITSRTTVSHQILSLLFALGAASAAFGQNGPERATATLNGVQNGGLYDYTISLDNTGTVPIGTFWYAWIPGQFYLPSAPASEAPPTGWTASTPSLGGNYSIEYSASSSADYLQPGSSLNFDFTSSDTPATLAGDSSSYPGTPIGTSYLYEGAAFSDQGYQFVVQSIPEPSVAGLLTAGFLGLASARRWKLRRPGATTV